MSALRSFYLFLILLLISASCIANSSTANSSIANTPAHPVAKRVITLTPHATELAFSAGLGDSLVGVSESSDYPPQALKLERVSNYQGIKLERIIALKPDLVIAWSKNSSPREVEKLKQFGIPVYYSSINTLDDIADSLEDLSRWAPDPTIGQQQAQLFRQQLTAIRTENKNKARVNYFFQMGDSPIITMSDPYWPSAIFDICHGHNIFANSSAPYPQVGREQVINAKPQVIFTSNQQNITTKLWQDWPQIPAVKHQFIWTLNPDWLNRPTMRSLKAIKQVCDDFDQARHSNKVLH
ncbi:vitamin B12 ABC transporter substrate-binding protein BtuF [Vibrio sp. S11_S32]|uniref:vitamin B12 ABC transporter substrate-binding protein BtuF n=1 Tax=Vibrio sp. S11_S32 TaxID=2720225 RepID=UPI00168083EB|nr:vitamin B12 ABC transporter substrate-binding protein BtuF [Vibrio sp. S11_S32]MBD1575314.1 vitamin B12 ABC transporter substrate-binding protein BtuF [Vibrio sp. S11_S32]